jgi:hypothetical protein
VPALVVVCLGGCALAAPFERVSGHTGSVVVGSVQEPAADGGIFTEGALVEVRLRDASGAVVDTERGNSQLRFDLLSSGAYTVEPGLRPCDGNCGYLDPRVAECASPVTVGATTVRLRVVFHGRQPCVVTEG